MTAIPVGLIGAGRHGERYLRHLRDDVPELRLAAICRRDAARGRADAEATGARFVADFRELAASPAIEAVIAVVPPALHLAIARLALGAKKALLLEKPIAPTVADAREVVGLAERAAVPAMVAHTLRFDRVVRAAAERIGELGSLRQIALAQRFEPSSLAWLDDPAASGGGVILHTGVHSFDLVRFLSGRDPASVAAAATRSETARTEDGFAAIFRFRDPPLLASVTGSRATRARSAAIEIAGERGQLLGDHHTGALVLRLDGLAPRAIDVGDPVPTVRETLRAFARALRGEPVAIPLREGLWSVACAEACYRSLGRGAFVPVVP
jgi:predicted dehydrogenase